MSPAAAAKKANMPAYTTVCMVTPTKFDEQNFSVLL